MVCIFLPELPQKPGCFPTAAAISPGIVAFSGTFFFSGGSFSMFCAQNQDVSPPPTQFPPCFVALFGTFSSAAAVPPCFTPKTRMSLHRHTISSMFCGVFRDIFFCGGSFSMIYPQNQDVFPLPLHFLHVLWRFPGHFSSREHFLHVLRQKPGCFSTAPQFPPCFVAFSRIFFFLGSIFSRKCGVFRDIFSPRWNRQNFCGEEY